MQHLDDGLLHELVDGEVSSDQLGPIQRHLDVCAACRARLEAARGLTGVAEGLIEALDVPGASAQPRTPVLPLPVRRATPRWSRGIGIAASLAVAVGLGYGARDLVPPSGGEGAPAPIVTSMPAGNTTANAVVASEPPAREAPPVLTAPSSRARPVTEPAPGPAPTEALAGTAEGDRAAAKRAAEANVEVGRTTDVARPMAPEASGTAAPVVRGATAAQRGLAERLEVGRAQVPMAANALVPRDANQASAKMTFTPVVIEFAEAIAILGGRLRLVEGLVPIRLERVGDEVRVIYPMTEGVLILSQQRSGEELRWRLTAPAGFPPDSLDVLRRRVER
jgi:hypothetical protein